MPDLAVVSIAPPSNADEIERKLLELIERTRAGEFAAFYIVGFRPDGAWMTNFAGKAKSRLETVGALESIKHDVLSERD